MAFLSMHRRLPTGSRAVLKGRGVEQPRPCFYTPMCRSSALGNPSRRQHAPPYTVRTYNTPKVRFSATVGEEPEVEVVID
jgi:hypothetical protein